MNLFSNKWLNLLAFFAVVVVQSMTRFVPDGENGYKPVLGKAKKTTA
ncbi:MAG: hypothetical protein KF781_01235 [Chitinophagaceae bacterium]|nr:hypothetical protein [Chitinophagaceae bacterium]MCW5905359.1 hypothetical protein [Chitinophagaceae bacterium]